MFRALTIALLGIGALSAGARSALAQGFQLADESNRFNEARRQDQISRQLDLNYRMIYLAGFGPRFPNPFEPWPRVPGDIWGYPQGRPIVHPVGHESVQVSNTRWISRPVYSTGPIGAAGPIVSPVAVAPGVAVPAVRPRLPGPSDAVGPPIAVPPGPVPAPAGPREF
jgi:hypothetical protein